MLRYISSFLITVILCVNLFAHNNDGIRYQKNEGQWESNILYKAELGNGALFLESNRFTFNIYNAEELAQNHIPINNTQYPFKGHAYQVDFINSIKPTLSSKEKFPEYYNYFLGNDQSKWKSNIPAFEVVEYLHIYQNIDLSIYSEGHFVKYDFIINPKGNPDDIQLKYNGLIDLKIDKKGNLILKTSLTDVIEQKPYAYQIIENEKREIKCNYQLKDNILSFKVLGKYDNSKPLIIDPILIFASYSGSFADNFGMTATYGYDGSLFAGGTAFNVGYPTTLGAYDDSFAGSPGGGITDVVISRYDSTGSNLIYSTYIGGTATETVHSLIANEQNELYLYGATSSLNFPTDANSFDNSFNGGTSVYYVSNGSNFTNGTDIYVAKFNAQGSSLLGSTYLGGNQNDGVNSTINLSYDTLMNNYSDQYRGEIMLDKEGNCYIASSTKSPDFPIINGFDNTLNGNQDAVIIKLNSDLSNVYWSSYLGGDNMDAGYSIKVDSNLFVYATGGTASNNFPTSLGAINTAFQGGKADGYVVKIDTNGSQILASTLLGTNAYDQCYFVELDRYGSVYVVGQTRGAYPVLNANYSNPNSSNFLVKMDNDLTNVNYSTVFGNGNISAKFCPSAFLVDNCGNLYVSGWGGDILTGASLTGMPTTSNAFLPNSPNGFDFYLIVIERDVQSMLYGTYFGGTQSREHVDGGTSRFDKNGIVYQSVCAGCWSNDDFPTTPGAWSNTNNSSGCNNGTFKFDFEIIPKAKFTTDHIEGCAPLTVNFNNTSSGGDFYLWNFGNGDTTSTELTPIRTFNTPGTYTISLAIRDSICQTYDTAYQVITVNPQTEIVTITNSTTSCDSIWIDVDAIAADEYIWSSSPLFTDTLNISTSIDSAFVYGNGTLTFYVLAFNDNCYDIDSVTITFHKPSPISLSTTNLQGCNPLTVNFSNNSGPHDSFLWDFGNGDTDSTNLNPTVTYTIPGNYNASLSIFDSICNSSFTQNITVEVYPSVTVSTPSDITTCDSAIIYANSTNATDYIWSTSPNFTDTINNNLNSDSLIVYPTDTTTYYIMATNGNCSAMDSIKINFIGVRINVENGAICSGQNDTLTAVNLTGMPLTYSWTPISEIISGTNTSTVVVNPVNDLTYYVTAQNSLGCSTFDSAIVYVSGFDPSIINISADNDTLYVGDGTYLHIFPDSAFSYEWTPSNSLNNSTIANPYATPTFNTTYTVLLTENSSTCSYIRTITIYAWELNCKDPDVFLPNAFTPNGDSENDVLYLRGKFVEEMNLKIYNRWGELVFESNQQNVGWDGTYNGKPVDPAVFVYHLTVKCVDGQEYFKKGNVTVIR